ncbi:MAG: T9SS type A sorting domain-containing protein [Saprospirales bacterium]|nr:T9SS type A sorting domain-containing protein [Saprospirales bacterium]
MYNLNQATLDSLYDFVETDGHAARWAKNILSVNGEYFPPDYILDEVQERSGPAAQSGENTAPYDRMHQVQVYPNPASNFVLINVDSPSAEAQRYLRIVDILGNTVAQFPVIPADVSIHWDSSGHSGGIYFYALINNGALLERGKIVLHKYTQRKVVCEKVEAIGLLSA